MDRALLTAAASLAALALATGPANAQRWSDPGFGAAANVTVHRFGPGDFDGGDFRSGERDRHHGRHDRRGRDVLLGGYGYYGGEWALSDNRAWRPDSFNDWWHDRPDRAFPRWVQNNQNCTADRMWWSGSGWHC